MMTVAAYVLFVNGLHFMESVSRKIKMMTVEYIPNRRQPSLVNSLHKIIHLYKSCGFQTHTALMDWEFECLRDDLRGINRNTTDTREHMMNSLWMMSTIQ
jgi:hypothetical protein